MALRDLSSTLNSAHEADADFHDLIALARRGDSDAFGDLFRRFRPHIYALTRAYFAPGAERDDLLQEATIGFLKAVHDYRADRGSFSAFITLCVRRQLITFIKGLTRQKHWVLNRAISLDAPVFPDGEVPLIDHLIVPPLIERSDPQHDHFLATLWARCSPLERSVLSYYSKGYSFNDMGKIIGVHFKSVDNTVWRIKVKARKLLATLDEMADHETSKE